MKGYVRTIESFYKSYTNLFRPNSINTHGVSMIPDDIKSSIIFNFYNRIVTDWIGITFDQCPDVLKFEKIFEGASYQYIEDTINSNCRFYRIYLDKPIGKYLPISHIMFSFLFNGVNVVVSIITNDETNDNFREDIKIILNEIQYITAYIFKWQFSLIYSLALKIFCLLEYRKSNISSPSITNNVLIEIILSHYKKIDPIIEGKSHLNMSEFFREMSELYYENTLSIVSLLDTSQIALYGPLLYSEDYKKRNKARKELMVKMEEKECKDN